MNQSLEAAIGELERFCYVANGSAVVAQSNVRDVFRKHFSDPPTVAAEVAAEREACKRLTQALVLAEDYLEKQGHSEDDSTRGGTALKCVRDALSNSSRSMPAVMLESSAELNDRWQRAVGMPLEEVERLAASEKVGSESEPAAIVETTQPAPEPTRIWKCRNPECGRTYAEYDNGCLVCWAAGAHHALETVSQPADASVREDASEEKITTKNFGDAIRAMLEADPELAKEVDLQSRQLEIMQDVYDALAEDAASKSALLADLEKLRDKMDNSCHPSVWAYADSEIRKLIAAHTAAGEGNNTLDASRGGNA